jgi:putative NADPH-quinone reductase
MNILIVTAHPSSHGYTHVIANTYAQAKKSKGHTVELVNLYAKEYKTDLLAYENMKELKLSLVQKKFQNQIQWAHEIVVVHPIWWGTTPAIMKNWVDITFWPGIAYKYTGPGTWLKLLDGKSAKIFATCGGPAWYYKLPFMSLKSFWCTSLFEFCGVDVVDVMVCGNLNVLMDKKREKHFEKFLKKVKKC